MLIRKVSVYLHTRFVPYRILSPVEGQYLLTHTENFLIYHVVSRNRNKKGSSSFRGLKNTNVDRRSFYDKINACKRL